MSFQTRARGLEAKPQHLFVFLNDVESNNATFIARCVFVLHKIVISK